MFIDTQGAVFNDGAVFNGVASGPVAEGMDFGNRGVQFDAGFLRPYINNKGQRVVKINTGKMVYNNKVNEYFPERRPVLVSSLMERGIYSPVFNATTLRIREWIDLDTKLQLAMRQRLRAWADLAAANSYGGINGMAKMTHEYEAQSDPGEAVVDMDGLTDGRTATPLYKLRGLPLPITHSDFWYSERRLAVSRNSNSPLDTTMAEAAGRRVAELIEQTLIGSVTGITFGTESAGYGTHDNTSAVYGYTNHPQRLTKTNMTAPTGSNPEVSVANVLTMRNTMYDNKFYGPYMIYHSTDWDQYLDNDYARLGGNNASMTLRDRLRKIEGVMDVRRLDFLTSTFTMLMIQMTSDVAQAINGMEPTTVQWESSGGLRRNFKVMAIQVPLIRYDYNGVAAVMHGTTA